MQQPFLPRDCTFLSPHIRRALRIYLLWDKGGVSMRRLIEFFTVAVLCGLLLSACGGGKAQDVLWYQNAAAQIAGTYETEQLSCELTLSLAAKRPEGGRDVTVTYTAPPQLAGMVFRLRDGEIFAVYDTLEIPLREEAGAGFFAPAALFALDSADMTDIVTGSGGATTVRFAHGKDTWEVVTDAEGVPQKITATVDGASSVFTVTSFVQSDE